MNADQTIVPNVVIDVWMLALTPGQFRLVIVFLRYGYTGERELPYDKLHRAVDALGTTWDNVRRHLNVLLKLGVVRERRGSDQLLYSVNLAWKPVSRED